MESDSDGQYRKYPNLSRKEETSGIFVEVGICDRT
jgi:hypothetical protein